MNGKRKRKVSGRKKGRVLRKIRYVGQRGRKKKTNWRQREGNYNREGMRKSRFNRLYERIVVL